MVTFISQCEKNALKKTRRVLDAFANRIGDNTWQTLITEDGLYTVKKMLRQTASKSTAVSCFWIRSRARSQFLWVVGNKAKFNAEGIVPVNYTQVIDIKMDETKQMTETVYANTQKQLLAEHLFAVGYLAQSLIKKLVNDDGLANCAFIAGCMHDLGKLDPEFRAWVTSAVGKSKNVEQSDDGVHIEKASFSFEKHPTHNEISLWLLQFVDLSLLLSNKKQQEFIEHVVYWHHAKPIRKEEYIKLNDIHRKLKSAYKSKGMSTLVESAKVTIKQISQLNKSYLNGHKADLDKLKTHYDEDVTANFRKQDLPEYKQYDLEDDLDQYSPQVRINAKTNLLRACVISADRQISALSSEELSQYIESGTLDNLLEQVLCPNSDLGEQINKCLTGFEQKYPASPRNKKQSKVAIELLDAESIAVLNGPAGCGKTKIALEWAKLTDAKKIIWVCPRVQVCEGLYADLTSDDYLPNCNIEICTGEFKHINVQGKATPTEVGQEFSGDIVLTTIDQIINSITTHTNVTALVDFLNCHVVFDEYHEYIPMPAFNLLFSELIEAKKLKEQNANTLLVSATPNYCFVEQVLELDTDDIINMDSFNQSLYQIEFNAFDENDKGNTNPLFMLQPDNTIVISNTATTAQQAFIANQSNENSVVFHGKFKAEDKQQIFNKVYRSFKQDGSKEFNLLRSGPIVQASLNITCSHMVTEFTLAENWLQRLGRLDRFGENDSVNIYSTAMPEEIKNSNGKIKGNCARFLNSSHSYRSAYAWYEFLQSELNDNAITINQIYKLYEKFYASTKGQEAVSDDLLKALKESVQVINNKVHDPLRFGKKKKITDKKKLKKSSLRGDSRFVQMALCQVNESGDVSLLDQYACDITDNIYTMSINEIEAYDPSGDKNLLSFMHQKHHKILSAKTGKNHKKAHKSFMLKNQAVEPETPIYVSYTPADLSLTNDLGTAKPNAIYYVQGAKQIIGAMALDKVNF